ncbi:MAG: hypothetical protein P9L99_08295 [Candidatus Lernaella stagnicola]|nr:hypothetical protein [Candidatus Lernaella stagnicola]
MKKVALLCALALLMSIVSLAAAEETQTVDVLISKLVRNYALSTEWGNIYFDKADLHRLIDSAAKLRPVRLGDFQTDLGKLVSVKALGYDKGVATLLIKSK